MKDYMRASVVSVLSDTTIREAVTIMTKKKTNGLVVVDDAHRVVGMLSSWDIIQFIVPDYLEEDKHLASFESGDVFAERICALAERPISDCMTAKKIHTIKKDKTLMEAITLLSEFHIRQLPVVDEDGVLVGYLNRTDVKLAISDVLKTCSRSERKT